jgi:hypothetical protein
LADYLPAFAALAVSVIYSIFKMPDAISLKALGLGADDRLLGIGIQKIKIN